MKKNLLITGATGFLGKYIVREFIKNKNYQLTLTDIPGSDFSSFKNVKTVGSDLRNKGQLINLVKNQDIIVNVAGLVNLNAGKLLFDINYLGVKNLCEAAAKAKVKRLLHISSIGVYGKTKSFPVYEDNPKHPQNNYEKSKWLGEQEVFKYSKHFEVIAVRPAAVYGIGCQYNSVLPYFNMLKTKKIPFFKNGPQLSYVHVEDVARAIVFLVENPRAVNQVYNLADDHPLTLYQMFKSLVGPLKIELKNYLPAPKWLLRTIRFPAQKMPSVFYRKINQQISKRWEKFKQENKLQDGLEPNFSSEWFDYLASDKVYSNQKIKRLGFKFKYQDAEKGLRKMVNFYLQNNYLKK